MIEYETIKPGDKFFIKYGSGIAGETRDGGLRWMAYDWFWQSEYVVLDPPLSPGGGKRVRLETHDDVAVRYKIVQVYREHLLSEPEYFEPPCNCQISTLMLSGCKCGAIEKEREHDRP